MSELRMSFAAFSYYAKRRGIEFEWHSNDSITFHYSGGKNYYSAIMPGNGNNDCGYIVVNIGDFNILFGDNCDYNKDLMHSERPKQKLSDGTMEHCRLPPDLWGKIETEISPGKTINCLRE